MIGKIVNVLGVIVAVIVVGSILLFLGVSVVEFFLANTVLLWIVGAILAFFILVAVGMSFKGHKLESARKEYDKLLQTHGYDAREHCLHKVVQFSQQDFGVVSFTNKWCSVCGKDLGPATLKKSIFGNSWR